MTEEIRTLRLKKSEHLPGQPHDVVENPWNILIVDDEDEVHKVTAMILRDVVFNERSINLISAHTAKEAEEILESRDDIAMVLLDVVMEHDAAGLDLVEFIRGKLKNKAIRIILRTGQPGQAPEEKVIVDYDINDYKAKSELTAQKLFTTVVASLRAYDSIRALEKNREGLEKILDSTDTLFKVESLQNFSSGVLTQVSAFLGCSPNGILCVEVNDEVDPRMSSSPCSGLSVIGCAGEYERCVECSGDEDCNFTEVMNYAKESLSSEGHVYSKGYLAVYLDTKKTTGSVVILHGADHISMEDRFLLDIFTSKISLALANAIHYEKMMKAEEAARKDYLTELYNRRQLISAGVKLVSAGIRSKSFSSIAMIDIDHFKEVNDTYGHDAGDIVLKTVADLLTDRLRESDIIARFGGEEFCVLASGTNQDGAKEIFEDIRRCIESTKVDVGCGEVDITVSIGVASSDELPLDDMISNADKNLYKAKASGRNRVVI